MEKNNSQPGNQNNHINRQLIEKILSLKDLETYLRLKFKDYAEAGQAAGISETRVRQIIIGYKLPMSSKLINQVASGWGVDPVKLTLLFDNYRNKYGEENNATD